MKRIVLVLLMSVNTFSLLIPLVAQSSLISNLKKQAQEGNSSAQLLLAHKYEEGDGIDKDLYAAIMWYKKAISGGRNIANVLLGALYDREKNYAEAYNHFMQYYTDVRDALGANGKIKIDKIDPNLLTLSQYKIGEYKLRAVDGVEKDIEGAISFLKDAASNNYGVAAFLNLSNAYLEAKDSVKAFENTKIAFDKYHDDMSMANLSICYIHGIGCKQDFEAAYELLEPIASKGNTLVLVTLGDLCWSRDFNKHSYEKAFHYYSLLLENSKQPSWKGTALRRLSRCYRFGRGVQKDLQKANELLKEAAQYGDKDAKSLLEMTEIN